MDIHKYNTQVRQAMSDKYVECSKRRNAISKEILSIKQKLVQEMYTITHIEYTKLKSEIEKLNNEYTRLTVELKIWDQARELCLDTADEICSKSTFESDLIHIKGTVWYAGDSIFIESKNPKTMEVEENTLLEIFKDNVKENSKASIIINAEVNK